MAFQYHESGETIDRGRHGKVFESDFGKFLLFRLICQRETFRNFKITREKKGTGKFDDFVFAFDSDDGKMKYSLIQLKHLSGDTKKISFNDLKSNSNKSYFGLPYYFDYYCKSLSVLSGDKDLKDADLESLVFFTNAGFEDSLECICKREILNEGLFRNCGNLYKLSINKKEREEIFHEQFLSERKRLANQLAPYIRQNKGISLGTTNDDSLSLIQKFSEMLMNLVFDKQMKNKNKELYKFRDSFLDKQLKNKNKELYNFRTEFFESLFDFQEKFPKKKRRSKKFKSSFPTDKWDIEGFIEFLEGRTITIKINASKNKRNEVEIEQKSIRKMSEELVFSIMLQKTFEIELSTPDQKSLKKLSEFIMEVIDFDSKNLRETFLCGNSNGNEELRDFRQQFFKDLKKFCEYYGDRNIEEIEKVVKLFTIHLSVESFLLSLKLILENGESEKIEFLKNKNLTIKFPNIEMFPSGEVDTAENVDKNRKFLNLVTFAVNQNNFENLISNEMNKLITKEKDQMLLYKGFNDFMDNWHNEEVLTFPYFESSLKYRKWITEVELVNRVKNLNILFQNREVKLSDICPGCEIITPEVFLYNFSTTAILNLGKSIEKDFRKFYIPRTLFQSKKVNITSLIKLSPGIIIFTLPEGLNPTDFEQIHALPEKLEHLELFNDKHNYYYTKENFDLLEFCSKNSNYIAQRAVHWMTFLGKDIRYESSHPKINTFDEEDCPEFLHNNPFTCFEISENENFVIITGEPGSGKSVLMNHLSIEVKNLNDRLWVILIPLNKYQKYLDKYESFNNIEDVMEFLGKIENCENDFSRNALRYFLENNRLILVFDGFDEIHEPGRQRKILQLLKFLKNDNLTKQIWITSKPHYVPQIEEVLGCVAFEVEDISEDEQIQLVINEWKTYHDNSPGNLIEENAVNFVENINDDIGTDERDFLGVPFQTYMFAHAYKDEAVKPSSIFLQNIGLVRLFDDFIESKYNIFFTEKVKTEKILQKVVKNDIEKCYQIFSLRYGEIISCEHCSIFSKAVNTTLDDESIDILKKVGLIYETSGFCTFIHETFAEYYIADLLLSIIENCQDDLKELIRNILLEPENDLILEIFDTHLVKKFKGYKIQESIMNGNEAFVKSLDKKSLSAKDILGRNYFYYALQENQLSIVSYLISNDVEIIFEPFFIDSLKKFAKNFVETKNFSELFQEEEKEEEEIEKIYCKLFEYILEKESENGYFASECLDQCLTLEQEMQLEHWVIATMLINKFGKKLDDPNVFHHGVFNASEIFWDAYINLLGQLENTKWSMVVSLLFNIDIDRLKVTINRHRGFIIRIPLCSRLLDQNYLLNIVQYRYNGKTFSSFVNYIKKKTEKFNFLFKFLFESKDVSFAEFDNYFMLGLEENRETNEKYKLKRLRTIEDGSYHIGEPILAQDFDKSIHSLRDAEDRNSYSTDLLHTLQEYMGVCDYDENTNAEDAALKVVYYLLSRGDEEHVKRIYNECCDCGNLEQASQLWEEAKRTELSKYYKIKTSHC